MPMQPQICACCLSFRPVKLTENFCSRLTIDILRLSDSQSTCKDNAKQTTASIAAVFLFQKDKFFLLAPVFWKDLFDVFEESVAFAA